MYIMYNMIYHFYHQISLIIFVYAGDGKNRSRKPMTITICNQILLKTITKLLLLLVLLKYYLKCY